MMLVCDLQGVKSPKGKFLTDPAIHCSDLLRFGKPNLGVPGMREFFKTHKCNNTCRFLKIEGINVDTITRTAKKPLSEVTSGRTSTPKSSPKVSTASKSSPKSLIMPPAARPLSSAKTALGFCSKCGLARPNRDANFCPKCGQKY